METSSLVYPSNEIDAMYDMVGPVESHSDSYVPEDEQKEGQTIGNGGSRIQSCIWNQRGWTHWVVGDGREENEIMDGAERIAALLEMAREEAC